MEDGLLEYALGCAYSLTVEAVARDTSLETSKIIALSADYARQSVTRLRRAWRAGYPGSMATFPEWKNDPDLKALKDVKEFQDFASAVETKLRAASRQNR